ncbi:MAG TPA: choice-of-anchor B family protein [Planctomycetes bacterium]|nr:choice-of-anchor B family protein [Planctomycetota bacterium]
MRRFMPFLPVVLVVLVVAGAVLAHQEDPKARDRVRPYNGPGYRADATGPMGPPPGFPAQGITLLSWLPLNELGTGLSSGNDCWGYVEPSSGREYAIVGQSSGTTFVEITDPGNAQVVGEIDGPNSLWRDIKVYTDFAYIVSEGGGGIQIADMRDIDLGQVTLLNTVVTGGTEASHNVAIDETSGFLYRCGGGGNGLRFYDLQNPASPQYVGLWSERYVHDAQIVTYETGPFAGRQIAFCCSGFNGGSVDTGLDVVDVTNKAAPFVVARIIYPSGAYSHQGWLSEDRNYFYLGDELDEGNFGFTTKTLVFDVSDIENPVLVTDFTNGNTAIGHNIYTVGNQLFEANYRSGLRVFDATNPLAPVETAYFDTWPDDDGTNFNGLWSCYPYFPSGTVIGSDLERGLFVWMVGQQPLSFAYPLGQPVLLNPLGDTITVEVTASPGNVLDGSSVQIFVDSGGGFTSFTTVSVGGGLFEAPTPAIDCGTVARYYFSASTTGGLVWADPPGAPANFYEATSATGETVHLEDGMSSAAGWQAGVAGDTATTGVWTLVDPNGTAAQPENDQGGNGLCWVTGQGPLGGSLGENDVDGGSTTLVTPAFDLSSTTDPTVSYYRWYSNSTGATPGQDVFQIDVSANGGTTWVAVETVGPTGTEVLGGWIEHSFRLLDFVAATAQVQLRFIASDLGGGSIVEAAIDDIRVTEVQCGDCNGNGVDDAEDIASGTSEDLNGDGIPDECQCTRFVRGEINGDGSLDISDAVSLLVYLFAGGPAPVPTEAGDVNGDGSIDVADVIYLLDFLFGGGSPPPAPFPDPGC